MADDLLRLVSLNPGTDRYHWASCHQFDPRHPLMTLSDALALGGRPCRLCDR